MVYIELINVPYRRYIFSWLWQIQMYSRVNGYNSPLLTHIYIVLSMFHKTKFRPVFPKFDLPNKTYNKIGRTMTTTNCTCGADVLTIPVRFILSCLMFSKLLFVYYCLSDFCSHVVLSLILINVFNPFAFLSSKFS